MWKTIKVYSLLLSLFFIVSACSAKVEAATYLLAMGANEEGLRYAVRDAKNFKNAMAMKYNIPTKNILFEERNVRFVDFSNAMKQLQQRVTPMDTVYIYFSGHGKIGAYNPNESDCHNEDLVLSGGFLLSDKIIVREINKIETDHIYTFLDVCFAAGFYKNACQGYQSKVSPRRQAKKCPSHQMARRLKGTVFAASREEEKALERQGGNYAGGVFTHALLSNLHVNHNMNVVFDHAKNQVIHEMRQVGCKQTPIRFPY